jgi:hypothetical protein
MSISLTDTSRYDTAKFGTESITFDDIADLDSRFTCNHFVCHKMGNTIMLSFRIVAQEDISNWIEPIFTMPSGFRPPMTAFVPNDKNLNLQVEGYSGVVMGNINLSSGQHVWGSVTFMVGQ